MLQWMIFMEMTYINKVVVNIRCFEFGNTTDKQSVLFKHLNQKVIQVDPH